MMPSEPNDRVAEWLLFMLVSVGVHGDTRQVLGRETYYHAGVVNGFLTLEKIDNETFYTITEKGLSWLSNHEKISSEPTTSG